MMPASHLGAASVDAMNSNMKSSELTRIRGRKAPHDRLRSHEMAPGSGEDSGALIEKTERSKERGEARKRSVIVDSPLTLQQ